MVLVAEELSERATAASDETLDTLEGDGTSSTAIERERVETVKLRGDVMVL